MSRRGRGSRAAPPRAESIYNWIKEEAEEVRKPPMHRSKFSGKAPVPYSTLRVERKGKGSMGRPVKDTIRPDKFLRGRSKKGSGLESKPKKFERKMEVPRKPALPSKEDRPVHGIKTKKDFVVANALDNILSVPPAPEEEPDYLHKEDFGRRPEYLDVIASELEEEREHIRDMITHAELAETGGGETVARELSEDEREELLEALKEKWDAVNAKYQKITHQNISSSHSTIGQIRMKEDCERALAQLEKDIERLSTKGPIFVVDD